SRGATAARTGTRPSPWGWPSPARSSTRTAAGSWPRTASRTARCSASPCRCRARRPPAARPTTMSEPAVAPLVLVVDDEPQVRRFLRASLPDQGYRLIEATNGAEALRDAATRGPDAILLDLGLPDLDGVEVTRRLREWSTVPIVVLSARGQESDKIEALDAGAEDYP